MRYTLLHTHPMDTSNAYEITEEVLIGNTILITEGLNSIIDIRQMLYNSHTTF